MLISQRPTLSEDVLADLAARGLTHRSGSVLDFGCGAGVLGATLKRRYPHSQLTLLDVDAFAVESSRLTLAANGLEAEVIAGDGIDVAAVKSRFPLLGREIDDARRPASEPLDQRTIGEQMALTASIVQLGQQCLPVLATDAYAQIPQSRN